VFEEVMNQGESKAVPVEGAEGGRSAFPDASKVDALERVSGGKEFLA